MRRARIVGTGAYLPEEILTNHDLEAYLDTSDEWIRKRTGIEQRHRAADGEATSDMALEASKQALENAGVAPEELDAVLCCTLTPDQLFPASGNLLQGKLGAVNAASCDINAACSGFLYGLATATGFIEMGLHKTVLLVGADKSTSFITWRHRDTDILFADGAGAVVLRAEEGDRGIISLYLGSDGANHGILTLPMGGSKHPLSPENINDDPYKITMDGREVYKRAVVKFCESIDIALNSTGLALEDIALFVPHQANARITEAVCQRLDFPRERVASNIHKVGNTIAASIPLALHEANEAGRIQEGDYVLLASFGAGLTWGSSIIRW
ncbi:MAG: ketoacyl-ACP synthase III [Candidatus Hydrogenedentes bacterium]|nr:ketoacyl-ACP synthase III [Candidatus Hydrogenedentota bacterium]